MTIIEVEGAIAEYWKRWEYMANRRVSREILEAHESGVDASETRIKAAEKFSDIRRELWAQHIASRRRIVEALKRD